MSMTTGDELGKSDVFVKLAVTLSPLVEEAVRQGITIKEFERGLFGGLLCAGRQVINQFLIAQGVGDLGETTAHPADSNNDQSTEPRKIHRSPELAARMLRTVFGEHEFFAYVYREGEDRRSPIVRRPVDEQLGISGDRYSPLLQEYSMLFCCEQAFHSAVDAFERVFRHRLSTDTLEKISQRMGAAADEFLHKRAAPPTSEEGSILVLTADGKGVPLVKSDAQNLRAFEEKAVRPGNRRMSTVCSVYSVDRHDRTAEDVVAGLFRDDKPDSELTPDRPVPQHKHLMAKLPGQIQDLGDEIVRGSILALSWAAREVQQRRKENQLLVRLMDGQHSLWSDADACLNHCSTDDVIDILDIVHVAGYVGKAAKALVRGEAAQEEFIRDRLLRILRGDVHGVVRGLRRMATVQKLSKEKRADVDAACGYFTAHASRMKYDEYLAAGLPIATGVIEGACRHLVKDRLERTGMRWSASGAQAMLSLRCLKASNAWDEFQQQFLNPTPLKA
jgi:hypothetical protein